MVVDERSFGDLGPSLVRGSELKPSVVVTRHPGITEAVQSEPQLDMNLEGSNFGSLLNTR